MQNFTENIAQSQNITQSQIYYRYLQFFVSNIELLIFLIIKNLNINAIVMNYFLI